LKRQAFDQHLITTHWPSFNVTVFPQLGASYYKGGPGEDKEEEGAAADGGQQDESSAAEPGSGQAMGMGTGGSGASSTGSAYWDARVADGSVASLLASLRTRDAVEDDALLKLAGVKAYEPGEVWHKEPLLHMDLSEALW
jgi:hypothetical protein